MLLNFHILLLLQQALRRREGKRSRAAATAVTFMTAVDGPPILSSSMRLVYRTHVRGRARSVDES